MKILRLSATVALCLAATSGMALDVGAGANAGPVGANAGASADRGGIGVSGGASVGGASVGGGSGGGKGSNGHSDGSHPGNGRSGRGGPGASADSDATGSLGASIGNGPSLGGGSTHGSSGPSRGNGRASGGNDQFAPSPQPAGQPEQRSAARPTPGSPPLSGSPPFAAPARGDLTGSIVLPPRLAPEGPDTSEVSRTRVRTLSTADQIWRRTVVRLKRRANVPVSVVEGCRQAVEAAASRFGPVRVAAAAAGSTRAVTRGRFEAPIEMQVVYYASEGGYEVRRSRVACRLNAAGRVVGAG